jgi:phage minor structural protein
MIFYLYDRWGKQLSTLTDVISAVHMDEVNGEDSLTISLPKCGLIKGQRIVWKDKWNEWHEHIVNEVTSDHTEDGLLYETAYCENSITEVMLDYVEDLRCANYSAKDALTKALSVTRWQVGSTTDLGLKTTNFYHESAYEALSDVLDTWSGEFSTTIEVSGEGVSARKFNIHAQRGEDNGKYFSYEKDMQNIQRVVSSDDVITACYGYGKGLQNLDDDGEWTGGYERKLTFGDVNGSLDYVCDEEAKLKWGHLDANGNIKHSFGKVEFSDCEDATELLALTKAYLETVKQPRVEYTATVIDLADYGYAFEDVRAGDVVAIRDKDLDERLTARVLSVKRYLYNEELTEITLGNTSRLIGDVISSTRADLNWIKNHSASWDGAATVGEDYLNKVIANLNTQLNTTGGYTYWTQGEGIITYDKPVGQNPTQAIQILGGAFRIANSKTSSGEWNWRTFGTGDGFTADLITAGQLVCGDNIIDLTNGTISLGASVTSGIVSTADSNTDSKLANYATNDSVADAKSTATNVNSRMNFTGTGLELINSNGKALMTLDSSNLMFKDTNGVTLAKFGTDGITLGDTSSYHVKITDSKIYMMLGSTVLCEFGSSTVTDTESNQQTLGYAKFQGTGSRYINIGANVATYGWPGVVAGAEGNALDDSGSSSSYNGSPHEFEIRMTRRGFQIDGAGECAIGTYAPNTKLWSKAWLQLWPQTTEAHYFHSWGTSS